MTKTLLITKNDFEGIASSIILNTIFKQTTLDIILCKYEASTTTINTDDYTHIFAIGLKDTQELCERPNKITFIFNDFDDVYSFANSLYSDQFKKYKQLDVFCNHAKAYLDWSWQESKLYYGKNIDELSKYYNKIDLIDKITDRIINNKEIITSVEKQIIVFSKKIMSNYIEKNNFYIVNHNGKKFACSYCESNEIELANKILKTTDVDAVILANLNIDLVRIKTREKNQFRDNIVELNGYANNNGGTLKISEEKKKAINSLLFDDIISGLSI